MNLILVCSTNFKIYTQIQNVCVWWGEGGGVKEMREVLKRKVRKYHYLYQ